MSRSTPAGSGARVPTSSTRLCEQCGIAPLPPLPAAGGSPKRFCDDCTHIRKKARERTGVAPTTCEVCGKPIEQPYSSGQKYHTECKDEARREKDRIIVPAGDDQMDKLFGKYETRGDIHITDREDGTRLMILSDTQIPFVDEPLLKAVLEFANDFRPHDLILNGDIIDCYEISAFDTNPTRRFGLHEELEQAEGLLYDLGKRMAVGGKMWFIEGNHEERLRRYLWRHAGDIASVVPDLDTLLHLDQHCAGSVPYGKAVDYLGFTVTHGNFVSQYSAYTAKRHADRYQSSGCNGHTHRLGSYSWRDGRGRSHTWYEIGCLCRMDLEYVKGTANWQQGFLWGTVRNGALHPQLARVIETDDGRGFYAGGDYYPID